MAWILIVFLIFLGGLIAPFGDILGTKIGKARFSILKLRPKKTATIVTITRLLGDLKDSGLLTIERKKITVFDPIALAKRFN